ncbi:MAG: hypothetical protein V4562_06760 [Pseudomonadota bacterium]
MTTTRTALFVRSLLGAVALTTLAPSALAQSAEYRRGYDAGYRDGQAAVAGGQQGRPGWASRVRVDEALYGVRGAQCDARASLQQRLSGPDGYGIIVDNSLCGDPLPGQPKVLTIRYRCGNGLPQRTVAPEGSTIALDCR